MSFEVASSSLAQIQYVEETVWGQTPVAGQSRKLRMTGESLKFDLQKSESDEINASRQIQSLFVTNASAQGGINFALSYLEYDALLGGLMMSDWSAYGTNGVSSELTGSWDVSDPTKDVLTFAVDPAGVDALSGIEIGQWVRLSAGAVTPIAAGNVGIGRVTGRTSSLLEFEKVAGRVTEAGKTLKIHAARLTHGTTKRSFTLEKMFSDVGQLFRFPGMMVSKMSLSLQKGKEVAGSFDFMGKNGVRDTVTGLPGAIADSYAHPVISPVTGIKNIRMAGQDVNARYQTFLSEMSLDFDNSLAGVDALGELGNVAIRLGTIALGGSFQAYLNDGSMYDDFVNSITQSLSFVLVDTLGQGYAITLTNIDMSSVDVVAGKKDESVVLQVNWKALMDPTSGKSIFIDKL